MEQKRKKIIAKGLLWFVGHTLSGRSIPFIILFIILILSAYTQVKCNNNNNHSNKLKGDEIIIIIIN